jgi:hypothetical protein
MKILNEIAVVHATLSYAFLLTVALNFQQKLSIRAEHTTREFVWRMKLEFVCSAHIFNLWSNHDIWNRKT